MKRRDITGMPVRKKMCDTCPFGPHGAQDVREKVESRLLEVSQTCHSSGSKDGRPDRLICRGARDFQLKIMVALGVLDEPTDKCWSETWEKVKARKL
jgi:hypothetical protein